MNAPESLLPRPLPRLFVASGSRKHSAPRTIALAVACLLAAALPNDALLSAADSSASSALRSPSFYLALVMACCAAAFLPSVLRSAARCPEFLLWLGIWLVGLIMLGVAVLSASATVNTMEAIHRPFKVTFLAACFVWTCRHEGWRSRLIMSYLAGWIVFVIVALYLVHTGRADVAEQYQATRVSVMGMNENVQAVIASSGMLLLLSYGLTTASSVRLLGCLAGFLAGGYVAAISASRTGLVTLLAGCATVAYGAVHLSDSTQRRKVRQRATVVLLVLVGLGMWAVRALPSLTDIVGANQQRVLAAISGEDSGMRASMAQTMLEVFLTNPAGIGQGRSLEYFGGLDPHNGYVKIAAEAGVVGALLLIWFLFRVISKSLRLLHSGREVPVVACFVAFSVAAAAGQALLESPYWLFFSLLVTARLPIRTKAGQKVGPHGEAKGSLRGRRAAFWRSDERR